MLNTLRGAIRSSDGASNWPLPALRDAAAAAHRLTTTGRAIPQNVTAEASRRLIRFLQVRSDSAGVVPAVSLLQSLPLRPDALRRCCASLVDHILAVRPAELPDVLAVVMDSAVGHDTALVAEVWLGAVAACLRASQHRVAREILALPGTAAAVGTLPSRLWAPQLRLIALRLCSARHHAVRSSGPGPWRPRGRVWGPRDSQLAAKQARLPVTLAELDSVADTLAAIIGGLVPAACSRAVEAGAVAALPSAGAAEEAPAVAASGSDSEADSHSSAAPSAVATRADAELALWEALRAERTALDEIHRFLKASSTAARVERSPAADDLVWAGCVVLCRAGSLVYARDSMLQTERELDAELELLAGLARQGRLSPPTSAGMAAAVLGLVSIGDVAGSAHLLELASLSAAPLPRLVWEAAAELAARRDAHRALASILEAGASSAFAWQFGPDGSPAAVPLSAEESAAVRGPAAWAAYFAPGEVEALVGFAAERNLGSAASVAMAARASRLAESTPVLRERNEVALRPTGSFAPWADEPAAVAPSAPAFDAFPAELQRNSQQSRGRGPPRGAGGERGADRAEAAPGEDFWGAFAAATGLRRPELQGAVRLAMQAACDGRRRTVVNADALLRGLESGWMPPVEELVSGARGDSVAVVLEAAVDVVNGVLPPPMRAFIRKGKGGRMAAARDALRLQARHISRAFGPGGEAGRDDSRA
ncbi:hypothetical protein FNF28_01336 [Cafeteria roenbergensis]|uniref:Uncharacterized protein n=1 Tax=Cafeteria roenbergensis TaxID=33653 RepID=A0A5A8E0X4_CAFRO|nr:hypothetical protein FNF28_01336 [Cafeteria roenbergensis]